MVPERRASLDTLLEDITCTTQTARLSSRADYSQTDLPGVEHAAVIRNMPKWYRYHFGIFWMTGTIAYDRHTSFQYSHKLHGTHPNPGGYAMAPGDNPCNRSLSCSLRGAGASQSAQMGLPLQSEPQGQQLQVSGPENDNTISLSTLLHASALKGAGMPRLEG
jgi:hypothetical protein